MAGVKGRSGRRPLRDEQVKFRTIDRAWEIVEAFFKDPDVSQADKVEQAVKLCVKAIPTIDVTDFEDGGVLIQVNHNYNRPTISSTHVENTTVNQIEAEQVVVRGEPLIAQELPRINLNHAN
jgi:hypothetical protein